MDGIILHNKLLISDFSIKIFSLVSTFTYLQVPNTDRAFYLPRQNPSHVRRKRLYSQQPSSIAHLHQWSGDIHVLNYYNPVAISFEKASPLGFQPVLIWKFTQIRKKQTFWIMIFGFLYIRESKRRWDCISYAFCLLILVRLIILQYFSLFKQSCLGLVLYCEYQYRTQNSFIRFCPFLSVFCNSNLVLWYSGKLIFPYPLCVAFFHYISNHLLSK